MSRVVNEKYAIFVRCCHSVHLNTCFYQLVKMCPQKYIQCSNMNMKIYLNIMFY